jgi:hypothetical protein
LRSVISIPSIGQPDGRTFLLPAPTSSGLLGPDFHTTEHLLGHHEVGRDDRQQVGGCDPPGPGAQPRADDEPRLAVTKVVQDERPCPVDPRAITLLPSRRQMVSGVQDQMPVLFEMGDGELTLGFWGASGMASPGLRSCRPGTM